MSLWRRIRAELRGAWRSVKYDLGRRPAEHTDGPDVTSTGLSTFPGSLMEWRTVPPETDARPPRRFVAVAAFCLVALVGAIGSYLVVTRSLSAAFTEEPSAVAAAEPEVDAAPTTAAAPAVKKTTKATAEAPPVTPATGGPTSRMGSPAGPRTTAPRATAHRTASPDEHPRPRTTTPPCDCVTPPVPTPTAPSPAGSDPDPGSPAPSGPDGSTSPAEPSASADPGPDDTPDDAPGERRHRHRQWQRAG
ncbi:hypothetical protein [Actinoplanes awajinensis]|uniref:Uncharacterized protein n=1 Tax=Actinoplanes awajinensis subsp. mycoplanecinus TaxID=135947 RepID=A0A117MM41_9ACTN|nr:hypothetical protein [Actinoplanes awajinensis]KUL24941.1 hypothetical protein ADL15_42475 [Actinoplanes awajinensis subsp. mycoplanecinus]